MKSSVGENAFVDCQYLKELSLPNGIEVIGANAFSGTALKEFTLGPAVREIGIRHEWVRILSVYGPHDSKLTMVSSVIDKLMRGERPALTQGIQMWDYLYARDAADALYKVAILGKNGRVYPLGSGTVRPLHQYIEIIRDEINPELPLGFGEIPYSERQVMYLQADISQLQADTGFAPTVDFVEGIRETIRCNRKELERENQ